MSKYRKKPVEIEAVQYACGDIRSIRDVVYWCPSAFVRDDELYIQTLEGAMHVSPGDWVIKGVAGEFYPCKPEIFEQSYEAI